MTHNQIGIPIGKLAKQTSTSVQTLRYYETLGLMPAPDRNQGNQRIYSPAHAKRLSFIRHARELGFPLEAIRELLRLSDDPAQSCATADAIAKEQLQAVESRIARLTALRNELQRMIGQCQIGTIEECNVIGVLADHSHANCLSTDHASDESLQQQRSGKHRMR